MADAIVVRGATKTFGSKVAVKDLDLSVAAGSLYGFIGPNGAGKTTTIRMIMSILFPDQGEVSVLGHRSALDAKDRIGYLPEERGVYKKMRVLPFLRYVARLKGVASVGLDARIKQWLERMDLADVARKKCEELSKGMQQKLQFIGCVLHEPDLLILDEPFSGLDPINMRLLRDLIVEQHQRGATIIFSTHVMIQAEQLCERVVMIDEGTKVLDESMGAIRAKFDPRVVLLEPLDAAADIESLQTLPGIRGVERDGVVWKLSLTESSDPPTVIRDIVAAIPPLRIELHRPSLEDIFIQIVTVTERGTPRGVETLRAALSDHGPVTGQAHG